VDGAALLAVMLALAPTPATGTFAVVAAPPPARLRLLTPAHTRRAAVLAREAARIGAGRALGAVSTTLAVRSGLGNGPWDTLTMAAHHASGVGVGALSATLSAGFTAVAWRLGARPNPLLLAAHAVVGGLAVDWLLPHVARAPGLAAAGAYLAGAVAAAVAGATLVLGSPHARTAYDHALLGVVDRRGWGLRRARWALDLPALGAGWALGGAVGPGTVAYAVLVGPLAQRVARRLAARRAAGA
jgi:uncharacterized membrane protein YczE